MKPSVGWALVGMQFGVLSALLVFPAGDGWPRNWIVGAGAAALLMAGVLTAVVASFRLGTLLTPLPIPKNNGTLARDGIYRTVRHPIYTGVLVAAAGVVAWGGSPAHVIAWLALWGVLSAKVHFEEAMLREKYLDYHDYQKTSGRFLPRWSSLFPLKKSRTHAS